ncbi:MAG: hypothetical protein WC211_03765 [Dehalococcoidia bacterium]
MISKKTMRYYEPGPVGQMVIGVMRPHRLYSARELAMAVERVGYKTGPHNIREATFALVEHGFIERIETVVPFSNRPATYWRVSE